MPGKQQQQGTEEVVQVPEFKRYCDQHSGVTRDCEGLHKRLDDHMKQENDSNRDLWKEINNKVPRGMFMWIVGGLAGLEGIILMVIISNMGSMGDIKRDIAVIKAQQEIVIENIKKEE